MLKNMHADAPWMVASMNNMILQQDKACDQSLHTMSHW